MSETRQRAEERKSGRGEGLHLRFLASLIPRLLKKPSVAVLLLSAALFGCETAFDPFVAEPEGFALTGFLDARRDTQFVRVQPLADREIEAVLGDIRFTSTDLASGTQRVWQDSLVTLDDGTTGLLFFAVFRPDAGATYHVEATGEGRASRADVPLPAEPEVEVLNPVQIGTTISQRLVLATEQAPVEAEVVYAVRRADTGEAATFTFGYEARPVFDGEGFDVLVSLSRNAGVIRNALGVAPDDTEAIELLGLRLHYALVEAEAAAVEGGVGAFGAAAGFERPWTLGTFFVAALGFVDRQGEGP